LTPDVCRLSGPDGEGQTKGQAQRARGESGGDRVPELA